MPNFNQFSIALYQTFKMKYEDPENIKTDRLDTVVFILRQIKQTKVFLGDIRYIQSFENKHKAVDFLVEKLLIGMTLE